MTLPAIVAFANITNVIPSRVDCLAEKISEKKMLELQFGKQL